MNQIWDIILNADWKRQLIGDIREKENQINSIQRECGSCSLWMTNQCPLERKRMISCTHPICSKFQQDEWATKLILQRKEEVLKLKEELETMKQNAK
jgi:hypothetical protein